MIYSQNDSQKSTEFLIGGVQVGTPSVSQKWVEEFLASRRQGISQRTLEYYRDILYNFVGADLTPKAINTWLSSLQIGNAKRNYYQVANIFCNWLVKSKKIKSNPVDLVDGPKVEKKFLPMVLHDQLDTLLKATDNFRDQCILKLFTIAVAG